MRSPFSKIILFVLTTFSSLFSQNSLTTWPYGGTPDESRRLPTMKIPPLIFTNSVSFYDAHFAYFADFSFTKFDSMVSFRSAQFDDEAKFFDAHFGGRADFAYVRFDSSVSFLFTHFGKEADFEATDFTNQAHFGSSWFYSLSNFGHTNFLGDVSFFLTHFDSLADFEYGEFNRQVSFRSALFNDDVNFRYAKFKNKINFTSAIFNNKIDFRDALFVEDTVAVDFSLAIIRDTVLLGIKASSNLQKYDFMRANLIPSGNIKIKPDTLISVLHGTRVSASKIMNVPGSRIIMYGPVDLKIQLEKLEFFSLCDTLDYFAKKDIISVLKDQSFEKNKSAQFEIDYMFAKSTMYQKISTEYEKYSALHPVLWWRFLYNATMGLGYRPFRLIYWALLLIIGYSIFYMIKISDRINEYIAKDDKPVESSRSRKKSGDITSNSDTIINCIYFSAMVLFTFRLKRDVLTFFNTQDKRIIVSQWLLGFLIYVAFLTLSKSGSILHNLKDLFVG